MFDLNFSGMKLGKSELRLHVVVENHTYIYSLFLIKIIMSVTKSSHKDRGWCYSHLQVFPDTYTLFLGLKIKNSFDFYFSQ